MSYTEDDLRQALLLLERRVPDAADEFPLALDPPRRRTSLVLAAAGAVAATAVAATATVVVARSGSSRPDPHDAAPVATAPVATTSVATTVPASVTSPGPLVIDPTWLPATATQLSAARGNSTQYRIYDMGVDMHVDGYGLYGGLVVLSDQTTLPTRGKYGTPVDLTIAGHPAREWVVDGSYDLYVQISPTQLVNVYLGNAFTYRTDDTYPDNAPKTSAADLRTTGRHIATALRLDARDTLTPDYSLTYLPAGTVVAFVGRDSEQSSDTARGSSYFVVPAKQAKTSGKNGPWTVTEVVGGCCAYTPPPGAPEPTAGRTVQGHHTLVSHVDDGYGDTGYVLTVLDVRPDVSLQLQTGPGATTLAELYRIADGIRWNG